MSASTAGRATLGRKVSNWVSSLFVFDPAGPNWARGVVALDLALVPLLVFWVIGHQEYLVSAAFGLLLSALADPGGGIRFRVSHVAGFGLLGAGVTALGFALAGAAWYWLVLVSFGVTLAAGLTLVFGARVGAAALLLNVWFVLSLGHGAGLQHHADITSHTWAQVVAWAGGSALWVAVMVLGRLIHGHGVRPRPVPELPGDTARRPLTAPLVAFATIRAVALAGTVALAFGLNLSHGYWMTIAAVVAMKPSLEQTTLVASQRLVGAGLGSAAAIALLLIPAGEHGRQLFTVERGLEVVALVLLVHGVAFVFWNYTLYTAVIAAAVLILVDVPHPSDYSAEGYRVLWTVCGVGIGVLTVLLAGLLSRRTTAAEPAPPP
ncbi:FUSC family protein [Streptomyces sp. NPDC059853]|uniref:FUSC family protein n=1 Tax=Streptomyces sp. NPDC059853 TaxID=3346973 RepID=UPI00364A7F22